MKYQIVLAVSLALSACGGGSSSDLGTASIAADPPAATATPATPAATPVPASATPAPVVSPIAPVVSDPAPVVSVPTPIVSPPTPIVSPAPVQPPTPAAVVNASTGGIWTIPGPVIPEYGYTMFASDGGALFYQDYFAILSPSENVLDDEWAGTITVTGNTLSGTENEADTIDPTRNCIAGITYCAYTNDPPGPQPITGSIAPGTSITVNGVTWTASALYDDPSPLSALAGTWSGYFTGTGEETSNTTLMIASDGSFMEQDPGTDCILAGQFSTDDPTHDMYSLTWTYSGQDCLEGISSASGLAYLDYSVDPIVLHISAQTAPAGDIVAVSEMPAPGA